MYKHRNKKKSRFKKLVQGFVLYYSKHGIGISFVIVCIFIVVMAFSLQMEEPKHENGIWRAIVYLISGMDVDEPYTLEGRFIAICLLLCGALAASLFTGLVAAQFYRLLSIAQNVPIKVPKEVFSDHIVIFGWNEKTKAILAELDQVYKDIGFWAKKIIIVSEKERIERGSESIYDHVWHVCGSPTDITTLKYANLSECSSGNGAQMSVVLSDPKFAAMEADRQSLLSALAIEHISSTSCCFAEARLQDSIVHFKNACVKHVIVPDYYVSLLLAKTVAFPGLTSYVDELLSLSPRKFGSENKPFLSFDLVEAKSLAVVGLHYKKAVLDIYKKNSNLVCGLKVGERMVVSPDLGELANRELMEGDLLLIILKKIVKPEKISHG